jgi:hypothetical protein
VAHEDVTISIRTDQERRIAIVRLDERILHAILELPEGVRIVGLRDDFLTNSVLLRLEGDALPVEPTPPGAYPPDLRVEFTYDAEEQRLRFTPPLGG